MSEVGYLSRAWSLLARGRGWPVVVLMLCACALVPVVGWAFALGYEVEWASLVALGSEEPPRRDGIDVGRCLGGGVRALAAALGWCVAWVVLGCLAMVAFDGTYLGSHGEGPDVWRIVSQLPGSLLSPWSPAFLPALAVSALCATLAAAAGVRSAVRRDAGRDPGGVAGMVGRDLGGCARVAAAAALVTLACGVATFLIGRLLAPFLLIALAARNVLLAFVPVLADRLLGAASLALVSLLLHAMVGLWVRQFAVPGRDAGGPSDWAAPTPPAPRRRARGARGLRVTAGRPGAMRVSVRGVVVAVALVAAMAPVSYLVGMLGTYLEGPSLRAALDSYAVQNDKSQYGLTYEFLYQDTDGEGRIRYHLVSTEGGNVPLVLTCEFLWLDSFDAFDYRPAGWNYVRSNSEEWSRAYEAWRSSPGYDGPIR